MKRLIFRFLKDESAATAIEYALIAALVSLAIIAGASSLGNALSKKYNDITTKVKAT